MTSNGGSVGAGELRELLDAVRAAERNIARAVLLAGRLASSGVSERVEGLPLELLLALACRLTGADRRMLVAAGEVLADMPDTARLFRDGALSWGQVRAITAAVRRLGAADRAALHRRVAASAQRYDGIDAYGPDQLVWAVGQAVDQLRDARAVERAEARRRESSFVSVQAALDGGMRVYGELDAVTAAPVLNALDAAAGAPLEDPVAHDVADEHEHAAWSGTARGRQYAGALQQVCADWLGGDTRRPARPSIVARVDLSQIHARSDGTVDLAVQARDRGCRFPGSADPLGHTDLHHMVHREHGGSLGAQPAAISPGDPPSLGARAP